MATRSAFALLLLGVAFATPAAAHPNGPDEDITPPPPSYKGNDVVIAEQLGAKVPVDTSFVTSDGKRVTLGDVLAGDLPTILTFNYSDCPMLCSLQLNGLTAVLPQLTTKENGIAYFLGGQYRIVTIDLEPKEPLDKLANMKARYVDRLPEAQRATATAGWTFLSAAGDAAAIRRVADAVGFHYTYIPERAEWAHPAALIFLASSGAVTRYVYGIEYEPAMMRESIFKAGQAEPATAVGFLNRCYHYDPDANSHAHAGVMALRLGAAGFIVLLLSGLGVLHFMRRARPGVTRS